MFTLCLSQQTIELENNNMVAIRGPIYKESANKFFTDLKDFTGNELNIFITSPGGSVIEGMKMMDHINTLQQQNIRVNCIGDFAASMAFIILQACENRYTLNSGILMQHQMSLKLEDSIYSIQTYMKMIKDINTHLDELQAKRINISYDEFVEKIMNDWWIAGITAKDDSVVDDIVQVKCHPELYKGRTTYTFDTIIGPIDVIYSKCPLVRNPLKFMFKYENNDSTNIKQEILESFNMNTYFSGKRKIKSWF